MRDAALTALALIVLCVIGYGIGWMDGRDSMRSTYNALAARVEEQNNAAALKLAKLTRERDEKQALLDQQAAEQEKKDAERKAEIDRLNGELAARPVRVRVVAAPGGGCSGGATGEEAGAAEPGAGSAAPAYGVLPEPNSRRLGIALKEVETLSAAYSSCRAALLRDHTNTDALGGN